MMLKQMYEVPEIEVLEFKLEGVIASSEVKGETNEGVSWGGGY